MNCMKEKCGLQGLSVTVGGDVFVNFCMCMCMCMCAFVFKKSWMCNLYCCYFILCYVILSSLVAHTATITTFDFRSSYFNGAGSSYFCLYVHIPLYIHMYVHMLILHRTVIDVFYLAFAIVVTFSSCFFFFKETKVLTRKCCFYCCYFC